MYHDLNRHNNLFVNTRMQPYLNKSHRSGIIAFESGEGFIKLKFRSGDIYLYNYSRPGKTKVQRMKALAAAGRGLATYLNKFVRKNFAKKLSR